MPDAVKNLEYIWCWDKGVEWRGKVTWVLFSWGGVQGRTSGLGEVMGPLLEPEEKKTRAIPVAFRGRKPWSWRASNRNL